MDQDTFNLLTMFAQGFTSTDDGTKPLDYAMAQGWVDAKGDLTREGSELAQALSDQTRTRSVFRIG